MKYPKWASHAISVSQNEKSRVKLKNVGNLKYGLGVLGIKADPQEETFELDGIKFFTHTDPQTLKVVMVARCGAYEWKHAVTRLSEQDNLQAVVTFGEWLVRIFGGEDEQETAQVD